MKKDTCINCKRETLYNKDTHIDFRIGYVDTAGQLCLDCFKVIYYPKKNLTQGEHKNGLVDNSLKTTSSL
jgi:nitrate/TMAO reductase-like tetraheme cytochrome c subunit